MGACYSKSSTGARTPADGKLRHKLFEHNKKLNEEEVSSEKALLKENDCLQNRKDSSNTKVLLTSTTDIVSDLVNLKQVDHKIAPSDSGIESIGTAQDETQNSALSKQDKHLKQKQLQHQNLKICQNCGKLKLNGFILLRNSDNLCDSGLKEGSIATSTNIETKENALIVCQAEFNSDLNDLIDSNKNAIESNDIGTNDYTLKDINNLTWNSSLKELTAVNDDICFHTKQALDNCQSVHTSALIDNIDKKSEAIIEEKNLMKAPLAQYDSLETHLSDNASKKHGLNSDFQDITESLCKCGTGFIQNEDPESNFRFSEVSQKTLTNNGQLADEDQSNHLMFTEQQSPSKLYPSSFCSHDKEHDEKCFTQKFYIPSREKSSSFPKDTSLTQHKANKIQAVNKTASPLTIRAIPISRQISDSFNASQSSSGHTIASHVARSLFINGQTVSSQCTSSLYNVEGIASVSSDIVGNNILENMTSLNADSLDMVTSLSANRDIIKSTEDITFSQPIAFATTVDGMDCVIIPKETYDQMQSDLSLLKQQLLCLSSLIQESDEPEQTTDCVT